LDFKQLLQSESNQPLETTVDDEAYKSICV
jgi:hypothetical protein